MFGARLPVLGEGSVYERLRRVPGLPFDPDVGTGALVLDDRYRDALADVRRNEGERIASRLADANGFGRRSPDRQRAERAGRHSQQWLESHRRFLPLAVPVPVALLAFAGFAGLFLLADLLPANLRADLSLSRSLLVALSSGDMLPRSTTP